MPTFSEHQRCSIARAYRAALTLTERRALASQHCVSLRELALLAK